MTVLGFQLYFSRMFCFFYFKIKEIVTHRLGPNHMPIRFQAIVRNGNFLNPDWLVKKLNRYVTIHTYKRTDLSFEVDKVSYVVTIFI